jgi:hypothetical protein
MFYAWVNGLAGLDQVTRWPPHIANVLVFVGIPKLLQHPYRGHVNRANKIIAGAIDTRCQALYITRVNRWTSTGIVSPLATLLCAPIVCHYVYV